MGSSAALCISFLALTVVGGVLTSAERTFAGTEVADGDYLDRAGYYPTTKAPKTTTSTTTTKPGCVPSSLPALRSPIRVCFKRSGDSVALPKIVPPAAGLSKEDIYLLSDITGSMSGTLDTVKTRLTEIVNARRNVTSDSSFGVGSFGDESEPGFFGFQNRQSITSNIAAVQTAVGTLSATGGGDTPEANLVALYAAATSPAIGWRSGSRKIVAIFSDAPGHEPSCINGTRLTRTSVAAGLAAKKIIVIAIDLGGMDSATSVYGCPNSTDAGTGQMTYITERTGGAIIKTSDSSAVIAELQKAIGSLSITLSADTSACTAAGLKVEFTPKLPVSIAPGKSISLTEKITAGPSFCPHAPVTCKVIFTQSGALYAVQNVTASC